MIYKALNNEAKAWWYFLQIRKWGRNEEARQLERKSIREHVRYIRECLEIGGCMMIYDHGSILNIKNGTLSGYDKINSPYTNCCRQMGVPIWDKRTDWQKEFES